MARVDQTIVNCPNCGCRTVFTPTTKRYNNKYGCITQWFKCNGCGTGNVAYKLAGYVAADTRKRNIKNKARRNH